MVKLGKGSITNRALKTKNPFSSVEGKPPLNTTTINCAEESGKQQRSLVKSSRESGAAEKLGEEVVLVSLESVVANREALVRKPFSGLLAG